MKITAEQLKAGVEALTDEDLDTLKALVSFCERSVNFLNK